ncbi:hypothetical protein DYB32_006607 [Aphanomyces invadans]|uniref:Uncharacterized protein n=1 Tax=Aphanomyces invadans TaxID=157072 RepID=A0A3R6VUT2_9STRA|nr:hypothetical protein DYB32_006607 [Aphanomyces invadans]
MFRVTGSVVADPPLVELASVRATMSRLADATFVDVGCGTKDKTVALTADGFLCCFGGTVMERLVSLEASRGFALSVAGGIVAVAGAASTIRIFDPVTLEYKQTLPFPPSYGHMNDPNQFLSTFLTPPHPNEYAAAVAVRVVGTTHIVAVYADHTLVVFERPTGKVLRTFFFHHGPVTDVQVVGQVVGLDAPNRVQVSRASAAPEGTFVTCSEDKTVRFWNLDRHRKQPKPTAWFNPYCPELLHAVYASAASIHDDGTNEMAMSLQPVVPDQHNPKDTTEAPDGLKCLAVSDHTVAVGANDGSIHVVKLEWPSMPQHMLHRAHASAVQSVAYSPAGDLLASGGRDRLTHVHDGAQIRTKTLENHSGAVVAVEFTADGKRLISAGADHNLVFTQVSDHRIFRYNSFPVQGGKIHAMAVVENDYILTCVNTWVDVHTLISNKHVQTHHVGEHHRVALSPGAALVALGGSTHDKTIQIVDFHSGEVLAKAAGHGDAVTGLKFTLDGRRLLSSSNDGCIFVWRLSDDLQSALKAKLRPVVPSIALMESPPAPPVAPKGPEIGAPRDGVPEKPNAHSTAAGLSPPPPPPLMPPPPPTSKLPVPNKSQPPIKLPVAKAAVEDELNEWLAARNLQSKNVLSAKVEEVLAPVEAPPPDEGQVPAPLNKELVPNWARTFRQLEGLPNDEPNTVSMADGAGPSAAGGKWAAHATPDPLSAMKVEHSELTSHTTPVALSKAADLVPNWARTIRQPKSPKPTTSKDEPPLGLGKWGAHGIVDSIALCGDGSEDDDDDADALEMSETLYIKQSNGELHQVEVPLKPAALVPSSSWSLAHERELLNKKKKQQETANAVADMQAKLGLLGILKPKSKPAATTILDTKVDGNKLPPAQLELAKSPVHASIVAGYAAELAHEGRQCSDVGKTNPFKGGDTAPIASNANQPPASVPQSVDLSTQSHRHIAAKMDGSQPRDAPNQSVDLIPVDVSLSSFVQGHTEATPFAPSCGANTDRGRVNQSMGHSIDVSASLSHFLSGYEKPPPVPSSTSHGTSLPGAAATDGCSLQMSVDLTPVDASLSQFTAGYDPPTSLPPPRSTGSTIVQRSVEFPPTPVNMSLSHFVAGFHAPCATPPTTDANPSPSPTPSTQASADFTPVKMSLSHYVSGFHENSDHAPGTQPSLAPTPQQSVDLAAVQMSLSHFVSGFDNSTPDRLTSSPSVVPTTSHSADLTQVNMSLGHFVSGFARPPHELGAILPPTVKLMDLPRESSLATVGASSMANSIDLTTPVDASLGQFVGGYAHNNCAATPTEAAPHDHVRTSTETTSEPSVTSSRSDDDSDDALTKRSFSQYISGYQTSVDLVPGDISMSHPFESGCTALVTTDALPPPIQEDLSASNDAASRGKDHGQPDDAASQATEGLHRLNLADDLAAENLHVDATSSVDSANVPAKLKAIVRSLRFVCAWLARLDFM